MSWNWVSIAVFVFVLAAGLFPSGFALASGDEKNAEKSSEIVFIPPEIGTPKDRMGAGTRTIPSDAASDLLLLVPADGGLTTLAFPPLIWRLTRGHRGNVIVKLNPIGTTATELHIMGPFPPGDYGLDLSRSSFMLDTDQVYLWQLELLDPNTDAVVERSSGLIERLPEEFRSDTPAAAGLWFDALSELVDIGLSGRVQATNPAVLEKFLNSAGVGP
ncbi:DUF928 domain-containing protein [Ruegeria sp. SCSIO 43209]|uniref:DUF928 domain-containing protein n=1 Tax=Ruegeria sp. SCSIO 43209 TaxID=2793010 RepID=UPI00147DE5FC|nr:DUF928 domain-containing protein [Ruegeria sp. SCSIO 43209]UAB88240.1 DUF928 domain-containing protein [Ruegeria sp. SCSIO 43209]